MIYNQIREKHAAVLINSRHNKRDSMCKAKVMDCMAKTGFSVMPLEKVIEMSFWQVIVAVSSGN